MGEELRDDQWALIEHRCLIENAEDGLGMLIALLSTEFCGFSGLVLVGRTCQQGTAAGPLTTGG